ncbi:MAG: homocysteine S-methyltransferase family protein, partial [Clostridia bacterium]|nr:homocysteine S-methyltransferase family protein [Clostridia bacterium]
VALDIGPLGQLMKPMGTLSFDEAYSAFARQIIAGEQAGADVVLLETMSDVLEVKAAVLAVRENSNLPVFASMTYQSDGRTFVGCDPKTEAIALSALGVDALGINCSLGPRELSPIVAELIKYSTVPVLIQPNAGLPEIVDGKTVYNVTPNEYSKFMESLAASGVAILGGCCGTSPEYIRAMCDALPSKKRVFTLPTPVCALTSGTLTVELDNKVTVIGERINPTGKKLLKEKLRAQDFGYLMSEAIAQSEKGADILDVNCGLPEVDEPSLLRRAVEEIQSVVNLPLQIDSSDPVAIEAAVRVYRGKPIINSVCGKEESMQKILPIAAKYGAAIVALTLDDNGIPETAEERLSVAEKIINRAKSYGICERDIIVDCLVLTASAQQKLVGETIKAVKLVKEKFGVKTVLGVSNVSFGLPCRPKLNSVFLSACFGAGLDCAILNPMSDEVMDAVRAFRVLNASDTDAADYISHYSNTEAPVVSNSSTTDLKTLIENGLKSEAIAKTEELLNSSAEPMDIIENYFIPALDAVGEKYEKGIIFLPQLMQSAEAAKKGFEAITENMLASGTADYEKKGPVVIATVKGDVHDIGKNIVKTVLE